MIKTINQDFKAMDEKLTKEQRKLSFFITFLLGVLFTALWMFFDPGMAHAAPFDTDKAGKAMFDPIMKFVDDWYATAIFASGIGGAVVAQGDLKTRFLGFGVGSGIAGITYAGVKAGFGL